MRGLWLENGLEALCWVKYWGRWTVLEKNYTKEVKMRKVVMWGTGQDCKMRTTATLVSLWITGNKHYYISLGESLLGKDKTQMWPWWFPKFNILSKQRSSRLGVRVSRRSGRETLKQVQPVCYKPKVSLCQTAPWLSRNVNTIMIHITALAGMAPHYGQRGKGAVYFSSLSYIERDPCALV